MIIEMKNELWISEEQQMLCDVINTGKWNKGISGLFF